MKAKRNILFIVCITAIFLSCHKETFPPTTTENQPLFSFNGSIGGNSLNLQAGVNNYYMYSSFAQDSVGRDSVVYSFTGNLQSTTTTKNSIQITINDYKISLKNTSVKSYIDTALSATASYFYTKPGGDTTGYLVKFTPTIYYGTATGYSYIFGDGSISSLASPTHIYRDSGNYSTSLTVNFSGCGTITITNPIGIIKNGSALIIDSIHSIILPRIGSMVPDSLSASVRGGVMPYSYYWDFGDGSTSSSPTPFHQYLDSLSFENTYTCYVRVTDQASHSASYTYIVQDSGVTCRFDYSMSSPAPIINTIPLSEITINYTDASGIIYTSGNSSQPGSSTFQVLSVSDYKNNLNGELTKEITIKFNCILYNGSYSIPASGTAIIAVAYQ